ncbi:chloride channel protein [Lentilactobacillus senioris]|uniref:ClC family H(+)/Cl(-) exchange transporter n=1 Tax=Lentilactobacillus senioris TaxID=931534 RepID=UPI0022806069|nr:ClC family H(+)/Cl(-) exchange transporter [Lentilactobacillus senioris]MCY9807250.1 chloride channel protein [Lentilactobacillus senioris]
MSTNYFHFNYGKVRYIANGLLIGFFAGIVADLFRYGIEISLKQSQQLFRSIQHGNWLSLLTLLIWILTATIITGLLIKQQPNISGSGIPQVEAQLDDELDYNWWSVLWRKLVGGVLAIGPGLALGREGPSIQLGAAVGQGAAKFLDNHGSDRRIMIAAGAAGGLSAAFNAPIAGTMFVLEEVYHNFSYPVWLTSLASAVSANLVSLYIFGMQPVLSLHYQHSLPISQYWHLILLGILLGVLGRIYQWVLLHQTDFYKLFIWVPKLLWGLIPFAALIPLGIWHPTWLGGGNGIILSFNTVNYSLMTLVILLLVRFAFSMLSYGSGLPGGIFLPILSLGAIIGAIYGVGMSQLNLLAPQYVYNLIIISMAGYFTAIGKAPFTAILLVTEMVGSLEHLMPLAVLSLVAYGIDDLLNGKPIYAELRERLVPSNIGHVGNPTEIQVPVFESNQIEPFYVKELPWPKNCLLVKIQRGEKLLIPNGNTLIRPGDTLIVSVPQKQSFTAKKDIIYAIQQLNN